jgi:hypothetical protein
MARQIRSRWVKIIARGMDHSIGSSDDEEPKLPVLSVDEAMLSFSIKMFISMMNLITCGAVIANVIRHWHD